VKTVPSIVAVLIAAAGWYYMLYSRAAGRLASIEGERTNRHRIRLRRFGGGLVMLLGILLFAGSQELSAVPYLAIWSGVMLLLLALCIMALIDLRLTWNLRHRRGQGPP
jgi:hypothetical protein